jgi:hypothetical protein
VRLSKILAVGLVAVSAIAFSSSAIAGSRDRHPTNGDEFIGYVEDNRSGNGAGVALGLASIAGEMLGVRIPGIGNQVNNHRRQPAYQEYNGYNDDPGALAVDIYQDCRNRRGQINPQCERQVNNKLTRAAIESGETFICEDGYGNRVRTQKFRVGCRLESNMRRY